MGMAPVKQYLRWYEQMLQEQRQQGEKRSENTEEDNSSFEHQATTEDR